MTAIPRRLSFVAAIFFAATAQAQTPKDPSLDEGFYTGELKLSYSIFGKGASGGAELRKMHDAGQWAPLVKAVVEKKFVVDTYYYYLGRAAEELGYPAAAVKYYDAVINASNMETCTGIINNCAGFTFPRDAVVRKDIVLTGNMAPGKTWTIGQGPLLADYALPAAETLNEAAQRSNAADAQPQRGKFETEEEYTKRAARPITRLLVLPVPAQDESRCKTEYDHALSIYKIRHCTVVNSTLPAASDTVEGTNLVLANAFDRREIKRRQHNKYMLQAAFNWAAEYQVPAAQAAALESDLMLGIEVNGLVSTKKCEICDMRELTDSMQDVSKSLASLTGNRRPAPDDGWKDKAFREGVLDEYWDYILRPTKIVRYVVFRKSDQRILFEQVAR
jgi:hypothetical protein